MIERASAVVQNRYLDSVYLLALMVGLYPAIFFLSNNWFFVGILQSVYLLGALSLASFVVVSAIYLLISIGLPRAKSDSQGTRRYLRLPQDVRDGLIVILSAYLLVRSLNVTINALQNSYPAFDIRLTILLSVDCVVVVLVIIARKLEHFQLNLIRFCNVFLVILSVVAVVNLTILTITNYDMIFTDPQQSAESGEELPAASEEELRDRNLYHQVQFTSAPNIYLIVPDSYPSNPFLQTFFNFDNSQFSENLQAQGFTLYDDYFAAYARSIPSMHSMLAMQHSYLNNSIGEDSVNLREVIGGTGNPVVSILKQNGYRSAYLHETHYLVRGHCVIETCLPVWSQLDALKRDAEDFFKLRLPINRSDYNVWHAMQDQIAATDENSRTFTYKHFMDMHSNAKGYQRRKANRVPKFRKTFPAKLEKVNKILLNEIELIAKKDPSAIIVIVSDHGTWAGAQRSKTGLTENETMDKLNVFLAIKWGTTYDGRYDSQIKSSVNLFRYLFAWLSQDDAILETLKKDDGYFKLKENVWKIVENGEVMANPKRY
ncbi:MAG: hypothetical protein ACI845_003586 [Gammaproteobacteria bacterium]